MNAIDTLNAIKTHGLAVRQIPMEVISLRKIGDRLKGEEIVSRVMHKNPSTYEENKKCIIRFIGGLQQEYVFDDDAKVIYKRYAKRVKIPQYSGHWMCKPCDHNHQEVSWSRTTDNLAPTLEESVAMFLASKANDDKA